MNLKVRQVMANFCCLRINFYFERGRNKSKSSLLMMTRHGLMKLKNLFEDEQ